MTSNRDRAIDILAAAGAYCGECCFGECGEPDCPRDADWRACPGCASVVNGYARRLADAGLLAPDLPSKDEWDLVTLIPREGQTTLIKDEFTDTTYSIAGARMHSLDMLAAANHAEQGETPMSKTTQEWQQLLDGTTPAPWGWEWDQGILAITGASGEAVAIDADIKNSDLLAAAPEAVAEVIRLRKELEERIRIWQRVADKLENRGLADEADFTLIYTTEFTRILNGDTNG